MSRVVVDDEAEIGRSPGWILEREGHQTIVRHPAAKRDHLRRALEEAGWNVSSAARELGIERTDLHKRIRGPRLRREGS